MNNKIKVGFLVNFFGPAGVETFIKNIANHLNRDIFEPYVYVIYIAYDDYTALLNQDIKLRHLDRKRGENSKFFLRLSKALKADGIQVIHTNNWGTFIEGVIAKMLYPSLKMIHVQHGLEYEATKNASPLKIKIRGLMRSMGGRLVNRMVSVSKIGIDYLQREWNAKDVQLIYNGVELDKFNGTSKLKRRDIGLGEEDFVVCSTGRWVKVKNYACLFRALSLLKDKIPQLKMVHIGDVPRGYKHGNENEKIFKYIKEQKFEDRVIFLGTRNDVNNILPLCDVFALTSFSEAISLSLLEAQAAGLPAVVTDVGGNPEIIRDGWNGFLTPSDDEEVVADRIFELFQNDQKRTSMGQNAKINTEKNFSFARMLGDYQALYRHVAGEKV